MEFFGNKNKFFILTVISVCLTFALAKASYAEYTPPNPVGYVNDFAQVLSSETVSKIDGVLTQLQKKTAAEVAVVTLNSLDGYPIEDVGLTIGRKWGVGARKNNNGLVIVVAPNDRKMRIEVGYGLEEFLTDSQAGRIRDQYMLPYFKTGDYNMGIENGTIACAQTIAKGYGVTLDGNYELPKSQAEEHPIQMLFFAILLIFLCIKYPSFMMWLFLGRLLGIGYGYRSSGFSSGGGFGGFGGGSFGGGGSSGGW